MQIMKYLSYLVHKLLVIVTTVCPKKGAWSGASKIKPEKFQGCKLEIRKVLCLKYEPEENQETNLVGI